GSGLLWAATPLRPAAQVRLGASWLLRAAPCWVRRPATSRGCRGVHKCRSASPPSLRTAALFRTGLHMDAGLLGLRFGGILLGAWHLGTAPRCRSSLDSRLLGV